MYAVFPIPLARDPHLRPSFVAIQIRGLVAGPLSPSLPQYKVVLAFIVRWDQHHRLMSGCAHSCHGDYLSTAALLDSAKCFFKTLLVGIRPRAR